MDFLWDVWTAAEAIFLPELATYETEIFAVTAVVGLLVLLGKSQGTMCETLGIFNVSKMVTFIDIVGG